MSRHLEYRGYLGSVEVDLDGGFVYGKLLYLRDVVSYRADQITTLEQAFHAAVDDYLTSCAELGDQPDVPCKGTFNVRIGPDLHKKAALAAEKENVSLNEWMRRACVQQLRESEDHPDSSVSRAPSKYQHIEVEEFEFTENRSWQTQTTKTH